LGSAGQTEYPLARLRALFPVFFTCFYVRVPGPNRCVPAGFYEF
jgi:hypothetical protein